MSGLLRPRGSGEAFAGLLVRRKGDGTVRVRPCRGHRGRAQELVGETAPGIPHEELAQLCYEADLLVVGSRGEGHALPAGPARSGPDPERPGYLRHDAAGGSGEGEASAPPLWLPPGKIARRWLATWLAAVDDRAAPARLPRAGGVPVQIDLHRDVIRP